MGSKLGLVANNDENIASERQSLWMRPRKATGPVSIVASWKATGPFSIVACEACMLSTRCTPVALSYKGSEGGLKLGPVAK